MEKHFYPAKDCRKENDCRSCPFMKSENILTYAPSCSSLYIDSDLFYRGEVEFFINNSGLTNSKIGGEEQIRFDGRTYNILQTNVKRTNFRFALPILQEVDAPPLYRHQGTENYVSIWKTKRGELILEN